jgi:hypothetical protein
MRNLLFILFVSFFLVNCGSGGSSYEYVKPSISRYGKFRKGYVRSKVSTKKDALRSQNRSRYYYKTRGKYLRRKSN